MQIIYNEILNAEQRGVEYVLSMMDKCIMITVGGNQK